MQKKRNIQLLISLALMISAIVGLFLFNNSTKNTSVDKTLFQIPELEKVDRIVLQSPKEKIELKYNGTKWILNSSHEADPQMITVLFAALKQVEAKRKVGAHIQDSVQKAISENGIKVSCYEGESLAKEFRSMGNEKSETYFQLSDGAPYQVTIPGYRVYVASVFEVPTNDWRDKRVFNFNWQNIKSLEVIFSGDTKQSFKASFNKNLFSIEGINTDTTRLDQFMNSLFQLHVEKFLDSVEVKKYSTILSRSPLMTIEIHDVANQTYPLTIFPFEKGNEFLVGKINSEVVLLNPLILKEIIHPRNYFLLK